MRLADRNGKPTDLSHVLCDDVETAPLLDNDPQQLHQVVVPQLPSESRRSEQLNIKNRFYGEISPSYVMTEASAMKA